MNQQRWDEQVRLEDIDRRLAEEAKLARREKEQTLKAVRDREWERSWDAVKRRRFFRFLLLIATLIATAVLVTVVMFRILSIVFG